jgi:hypothetical protein
MAAEKGGVHGQAVGFAWYGIALVALAVGVVSPAWAITGGSGKYDGAEGQIEVQPVSQDSGIHIFHLKD